jgi:hypothetical protein
MNVVRTLGYSCLRRCINCGCFVSECEIQGVLSVNKSGFKIFQSLTSCTDSPNFLNLQTHSRCHNSDLKQIPYWGPTCTLMCHRTYLFCLVIFSREHVRPCITVLCNYCIINVFYYKIASSLSGLISKWSCLSYYYNDLIQFNYFSTTVGESLRCVNTELQTYSQAVAIPSNCMPKLQRAEHFKH